MRRTAVTVACLTLALSPAAAVAKNTVAPPGASAIDEYLETVPGAGGNQSVGPGSGSGGHALSAKATQALSRHGRDGAAAAALAKATAPVVKRAPHAAPAAPARTFHGSHPSPLSSTLTRALGGVGGGIGAALPILLALSLLGAAFLGVRRRRTTT